MLRNGDEFVFLIIGLLGAIFLWRFWKQRRQEPAADVPTSGKVVQLLQSEGYDIVAGRTAFPLRMAYGNKESTVKMTADYIVKKRNRTYAVKTEREDGEAVSLKRVRERYLPICLAFQADGVVIVSKDRTKAHCVTIARGPRRTAASRLSWVVGAFLLGAGVTFFWLY
ncbi:hypothetical protein [Numidum massiliense]|uniref:hypothetical protein n=1 Tax=Numidum massiliense TaxID=1522315 RepID=UPI0006D58988|nr:hypothetical protein [Numidum massiliense]